MAYKNDLQLAYSGREIALQRIEVIDSTVFDDQASRNYREQRRIKYQRLLERSDEKISEIKSRITEGIAAKKLQLEEYKTEHNHVDTRYKLGEISLPEREKQQNLLQKKYDQVKQEAIELDRLLQASGSSEIGGLISIDIDREVDGYGNINRKMAGLNIPNNIKVPSFDNLPNIKRPDFNTFSNRNMPRGTSTHGQKFSPGKIIVLGGAIVGIIAILLLALGTLSGEPDSLEEQYNLGKRYFYGEGVTKDYAKAVEWWTKAAEQGNADAQYSLGDCYFNGYGVRKDNDKAAYWYAKAANQGHGEAQWNLGICYVHGYGVVHDDDMGMYWLELANKQGVGNLGALYQYGSGQSYENTGGLAGAWRAGQEQAQRVESLLNQLGY
jgi:TPR repeat protein